MLQRYPSVIDRYIVATASGAALIGAQQKECASVWVTITVRWQVAGMAGTIMRLPQMRDWAKHPVFNWILMLMAIVAGVICSEL